MFSSFNYSPTDTSWAKARDMRNKGSPTARNVTILSTASSRRSPLYLASVGSFNKKSEKTYSVATWAIAMTDGNKYRRFGPLNHLLDKSDFSQRTEWKLPPRFGRIKVTNVKQWIIYPMLWWNHVHSLLRPAVPLLQPRHHGLQPLRGGRVPDNH